MRTGEPLEIFQCLTEKQASEQSREDRDRSHHFVALCAEGSTSDPNRSSIVDKVHVDRGRSRDAGDSSRTYIWP